MAYVQLTSYYDIPLHCPFCGVAATEMKDGGWEVSGCHHLQLGTADEFVIHMSDRGEAAIKDAGYSVVRDEIEITVSNEADEDDYPEIVEMIAKMPDAVVFEQIVGPPSLISSYIVFAYNDDDYAKFGETL